MIARVVSLVQIAATVACPISCGSGLCGAGHCCSVGQSVAVDHVCPVHATLACCCEEPSHNEGIPSRCPQKPCQGVCGGAVFQKPIELKDCSATLFLPLIQTDISFAPRLADCGMPNAEHRCNCHGGNHGRALRTRYMSFLC